MVLNKRSAMLRLWLTLLCCLWLSMASAAPRVLIIVTSTSTMPDGKPTGVWLEEFALPYTKLLAAKAEIVVSSPLGGAIPIDPRSLDATTENKWPEARRALTTGVALSSDMMARDFDAVFVPGGHGAMFDLPGHPQVQRILRYAFAYQRIVAAVCHGPAALVDLKDANGELLLRGKRVAAFTDSEEQAVDLVSAMPFLLESRLRENGADVVVKPNFTSNVQIDGQLITGQNPASSAALAEALVAALATRATDEP